MKYTGGIFALLLCVLSVQIQGEHTKIQHPYVFRIFRTRVSSGHATKQTVNGGHVSIYNTSFVQLQYKGIINNTAALLIVVDEAIL